MHTPPQLIKSRWFASFFMSGSCFVFLFWLHSLLFFSFQAAPTQPPLPSLLHTPFVTPTTTTTTTLFPPQHPPNYPQLPAALHIPTCIEMPVAMATPYSSIIFPFQNSKEDQLEMMSLRQEKHSNPDHDWFTAASCGLSLSLCVCRCVCVYKDKCVWYQREGFILSLQLREENEGRLEVPESPLQCVGGLDGSRKNEICQRRT